MADRRASARAAGSEASTSRRASKVAESEDESDVEVASQSQQPRRGKLTNGKQRAADQDEDGNESDGFGELEKPLPPLKLDDEFKDKPIKKEDAILKINNLVKEWKEVERRLVSSLDLLGNAACDLQEAVASGAPDARATEEIDNADKDYRALLNKIQEARYRKEALEQLRSVLNEGAPVVDPAGAVETAVQKAVEKYLSQTSRKKYAALQKYIDFRKALWESADTEQGMPDIKTLIDREEGDSESEDEEIEVQAGIQTFKDPITFAWLEKPVKTDACQHVYSRASITEYIRASEYRTHAECPVPGCSKVIRLDALVDDPQLERRVQQRKRRLSERGREAQVDYEDIDDDDEDEEQES